MWWVSHKGNWVLENAQGDGVQVDGAAYSNQAFFPMLPLAVLDSDCQLP